MLQGVVYVRELRTKLLWCTRLCSGSYQLNVSSDERSEVLQGTAQFQGLVKQGVYQIEKIS